MIDRDIIAADVDDLVKVVGYLDRLRDLLVQPATHRIGESQHVRHKVIGSPAPWNDEAAGLLFEVHAGARRHEAKLRIALGHSTRKPRGNADVATLRALACLPDLIVAAHPTSPNTADAAATDVARWCRSARTILDDDLREDDRQRMLTKAPGGLTCPHCERTLVLRAGWQHDDASQDLWCLRCPSTVDEEHPRGRDLSWPPGAWLAVLQQEPGVSG